MDFYDFKAHLIICLVRENLDKEFQISLTGVSSGFSSSTQGSVLTQKFNPESSKFE